MIYLIILIGLFALSYVYDYRRAVNGRIVSLVIVWLVLALVAGLRYRLGTDTINYMYDFAHIPPLNQLSSDYFSTTRFAAGYVVLTSFIKMFANEFVAVQLVHAFWLNGVVILFFSKTTRNVFFAILLYYCLSYVLLTFQQMRESFAVSFFLLAWPAFRDRKWIKWYALSGVALLFHLSATVMLVLPLFLLPGIKKLFVLGKATWIYGFFVLALGIIVQAVFFKYIELFAVTEAIADRAATYSTTNFASGLWNTGGVSGVVFMLLKCVAYPLFALYCLLKLYKQGGTIPETLSKMEFMVLMSLYVGLFSIGIVIWSRYNNYFYFFSIVVISNWVYTYIPVLGKWTRLRMLYWWMFFLPLLGLNFYYSYLGSVNKSGTIKNYVCYYPYSSWFDQTRNLARENCYRYQKTLGGRRH